MNGLYERYFADRGVSSDTYGDYTLPPYLVAVLPPDRVVRILDVGCGLGQMLTALRERGYRNLKGIDLSPEAVEACRTKGIDAVHIDDLRAFSRDAGERFDFILMSHVLEHLEKPLVIETLRLIRENLLAPGGALLVMVPNAQSPTGCYWAYEDFTHHTLFTAGSLLFALRCAGFSRVELVDPDATEGSRGLVRWGRRVLLRLYRAKVHFWNLVTGSSFHRPSPQVFSFEIKVLAR